MSRHTTISHSLKHTTCVQHVWHARLLSSIQKQKQFYTWFRPKLNCRFVVIALARNLLYVYNMIYTGARGLEDLVSRCTSLPWRPSLVTMVTDAGHYDWLPCTCGRRQWSSSREQSFCVFVSLLVHELSFDIICRW